VGRPTNNWLKNTFIESTPILKTYDPEILVAFGLKYPKTKYA
jgi:hypothetical protein